MSRFVFNIMLKFSNTVKPMKLSMHHETTLLMHSRTIFKEHLHGKLYIANDSQNSCFEVYFCPLRNSPVALLKETFQSSTCIEKLFLYTNFLSF